MQQRLEPWSSNPRAMEAMLNVENYLQQCGLEYSLYELVKIRASQINGCAFCLHMHTTDARKAGESDERMHLLNAWREAPVFSARERAALAWAEALTLIASKGAHDDVYEQVREQFSEKELVDLTLLITTINGWNRLAIAFASLPTVSESALQSAQS